jgi:hypothetical protein
MSNDANIFSGTPAPAAAATLQNDQSNTNYADLLSTIKNERGEVKYKDVATALEALRHSQEFIPQLKSDNEKTAAQLAALSAEVERLKNIEQSVAQLNLQNTAAQGTPAAQVSPDDVARLVNQTLSQREVETIQRNNLNSVVESVQKAHGDKAQEVFYGKAKELGMSAEQINSLAAQSPTAVLKLFGIDKSAPPQVTGLPNTGSSVNTTGLIPNQETYIGRNKASALVGATTADLQAERENSKKLVEELHSQGLSMSDLSDPKVYAKRFGGF